MTSQAAAHASLPNVRGLVFLGFPLHAPNASVSRGAPVPGYRADALRQRPRRPRRLGLVRDVMAPLGPLATLHVVDDGDHSFKA
jgi:hypothetical protein